MANFSNRYRPVGQDEADSPLETESGPTSVNFEQLPSNPPLYEEETHGDQNVHFEPMEFEDDALAGASSQVERLRLKFKNYVVTPVRERITDPLAVLMSIASHKVDYALSKVGNPLILRRFVYVFFMSAFIYYVSTSGLLPSERTTGTRGMFSDKDQLLKYARRAINLSKMEGDLEYISSVPHMAGTKGDFAISQYVKEAFSNDGLRLVGDAVFETYLNYPGNLTLAVRSRSGDTLDLGVNDQNFNPLSVKGEVLGANLLYAHYGSKEDYDLLADKGLIGENTAVLIHYDAYAGGQVLEAQERGIKAVFFISDGYGEDQIESVQRKSVQNFQYDMGDPLSPGWTSSLRNRIQLEESFMVPKIPTIPLSRKQAESLKALLSTKDAVQFKDNNSSGVAGDVTIDFKLEPVERKEHSSWTVVGKIEGREQSDKAIIISSARDSACTGCTYPNYGTTTLMALAQLFQQTKYKFGWKPLRNIYFISYDASQFGHAGATELLESELIKLKSEIYTVLDVSQLSVSTEENKLDIQAHPLLFDFFRKDAFKMGIDVNVRTVQQFGDWSAFLAHGIPVAVLSAPHVLEKKYPIDTCDDTFERMQLIADERFWERTSNLVSYVFQMALYLVDDPLIPLDIGGYSTSLEELAKDLQKSSEGLNLDFEGLFTGIRSWKAIGDRSESWIRSWNNIVMVQDEGIEPSLVAVDRWSWNTKLSKIGTHHCSLQGLPHRQFYKNVLFGPTLKDQGEFDSWSFPAVRDAISDRDNVRAQDQINLVSELVLKLADTFIERSDNA